MIYKNHQIQRKFIKNHGEHSIKTYQNIKLLAGNLRNFAKICFFNETLSVTVPLETVKNRLKPLKTA